jgi:diphthamide biosynthesis methyltransferase
MLKRIVRGDLLEKLNHGTGLHVLIVPGELHIMEKAFLHHFRKD